jgi:transcriptional regulator with XRE-family HTH domain
MMQARSGDADAANSALRMTLANNIRLARGQAGLTLRDLGAMIGSTHSYLSQAEHGRLSMGVDIIGKVAIACGVLPHDLLDPAFGKKLSRRRSEKP